MSFLEDCWEEREEVVYAEIFGGKGQGIYSLSHEVFGRLSADAIDPRWLTQGVFKCPPTETRSAWAYVTSGMSNPWESEVPEEYSGLGMEFILEAEEEATWALEVLRTLMGYNLLLAAGKMGDFPLLDYGDRIPLALSESINTMMLTHPKNFPASFSIKSGKVDLIQVVGITAAELEFAKKSSSQELSATIVKSTGELFTKKERDSVV